MDPIDMTGEINQQNRPSVFGFDAYPYQNTTWANKIEGYHSQQPSFPVNVFENAIVVNNPYEQQQQQQQYLQQSPFLSNFPSSGHAQIVGNYGTPSPIPGNFSFGPDESKPSTYPVQFPFPSSSASYGQFSDKLQQMSFRGKRKTDSPPLQKPKQFITEEKMIQCMSELNINSETEVPNESASSRVKRLYMCEEMRKLKNDPILPRNIMERISNPCTALVLWTPPPSFLPLRPAVDENQNGDEQDRMENEKLENEVFDQIDIDRDIAPNDMDFDL